MSLFNRVGGKSPHTDGLQITVTVPAATEANPIKANDVLVLDTVGPYTAKAAGDGDEIQLKAIHPVKDGVTPLGVHAYGFSRIDIFEFAGTLAVGDSIVGDGTGKVKASVDVDDAPVPNGTFVVYVDDTRKICEVLLP